MDKELQVENGNYVRVVNRFLEELVKASLLGTEYAVVLFVVRKTWGYNKRSDRISLSQFESGTNLSRVTVIKALKNLRTMNILVLVSSSGKKSKKGDEWRVNKYYKTWLLVNTGLPVASLVKQRGGLLVNTGIPTKDNTKDKNTLLIKNTDTNPKNTNTDPDAQKRREKFQELKKNLQKVGMLKKI